MTFALNARLGLDAKGLVKGAKDAEKAVDAVADAVDELEENDGEVEIKTVDKATPDLKRIELLVQGLDDDDTEVRLEAEAENLKKEIRKAQRDLAGLDAEEAAPVLKIRNQAKADLNEIENQLRKEIPEAAEEGGEGASRSLGGAFESLKGAKGALLGGAIGAGLAMAIGEGFDRIGLKAKFRNEFGLIKSEADRLSADAGDTYADGWGESADEVRRSLGLVNQKLVETGRIGQEETDKVATGALGIAEVFGEDVDAVIRSVSQLLLNGLAPDADSALDQVTAALQNGANGAGDFFDSIDEYSQHFDGFGLSAADMFKIFEHGLQNGQRDTDKLADAVKNMRELAIEDTDRVSDAYRRLGLNADEMRDAITKGGPSAKSAFTTILTALDAVVDETDKNAIALDLIGSAYTDLGPKALESLLAVQGATDDTAGANDRLVASTEDSRSELEKLKRSALGLAGTVGEELAGGVNDFITSVTFGESALDRQLAQLTEMQTELDGVGGSASRAEDVFARYAGVLDLDVAAAMEQWRADMADAGTEVSDLGDSTAYFTVQAEIAAAKTKKLEAETQAKFRADQKAIKEADKHAASVDALREEIDGLIASNAALVGGELAVEQAQIRARQAQDELNAGVADGTLTGDEYRLALIDATEAQIGAAEAAADRRADEMLANGAVEESIDRNQLLGEELGKVADTLDAGSELRSNVAGYSNDLLNITDEVSTEMMIENQKSRAEILWYIARLDEAARPRTSHLTVVTSNVPGGNAMMAQGGAPAPGQTVWVGEEGPELVTFGTGRPYVNPAAESIQIANQLSAARSVSQSVGVMSAPMAQSTLSRGAPGVVTAGDTTVIVQIGQQELQQMMMDVIVDHEAQKELVS